MKRKTLVYVLLVLATIWWNSDLCANSNNNRLEQENAKVLITPWPKYEFSDAPDLNSILIKGSWIGDTGGNFVYEGRPTINTVDIICDKSTGRCIESRAEVSPVSGRLTVESREYKVIKWTDSEVDAYQTSDPHSVFGHSFGAGKLTLRINRNNKNVILIGEYETDGKRGVWNAHLDSGKKLMEIYNVQKGASKRCLTPFCEGSRRPQGVGVTANEVSETQTHCGRQYLS